MKKFWTTFIAIFFAITLIAAKTERQYSKVNLVYIGNSITHAWYLKNSPPAVTVKLLQEAGYIVEYANCAVSGNTTVDFLPTNDNFFPNVLKSANALDEDNALLVFSIMLGTNDSAIEGTNGSPVSPEQYKLNLKSIINELVAKYPDCKIILNQPIWYSPNTHNGAKYLQEGLDRLQTYFPQIKLLADENPDRIYWGDTDAFDFFKNNYLQYLQPEQGNSGVFYLHPNQDGANKLAEFWAKSLKKYLPEWGCVAKTNRIKVACIGNSITENASVNAKDKYPTVLQRYIGEDYIVKNFGMGMRTMLSKGDYPYIKEDKYKEVLAWEPDIVIIKMGTNDAKDYNWVHKSEFQKDYTDFVNSFKNLASNPKIYVCYPLPVYPNNWLPIDNKIFTDEMIPMIDNVAQTTGASVIDLRTPFLGKVYLTYDQVHPNHKGTAYMAHIIGSKICPDCNIPSLAEEKLYQIASDDLTKYSSITSSSELEGIENLLDNNVSTDLNVPFVSDSWISFSFPEKYKLSGYSILSGRKNPQDAPQSWIIEGSNTGKVWYKIEERENVDFGVYNSQLFKTISNMTDFIPSHKNYRIKFKTNGGGTNLQIDEIQLFGMKAEFEQGITNNGGTISGQYVGFPGELVGNLNDMNILSKYCVVDKGQGWILYDSPIKTKIGSYSLTSCFGINTRFPRSWTVEASNDGVAWDILDKKTDQDFIGDFHTMLFPLKTEKEYSKFRLNILDIQLGGTFEIAEWQLFKNEINSLGEDSENGTISVKGKEIHIEGWNDRTHYSIFSMDGKCVLSGVMMGNCVLNVAKPGVYLIQLKMDKNYIVKKIII